MRKHIRKSPIDIFTIVMLAFTGIAVPIILCVTGYIREKHGMPLVVDNLINYIGNSTTFFVSMLTVLVCITIKIDISHFTHKYLILATIIGLIISVTASTLDEPPIDGIMSEKIAKEFVKYLTYILFSWCVGLQATISLILLYIIRDWHKDTDKSISSVN